MKKQKLKEQAYQLRLKGYSYRDIEDEMNIGVATALAYVREIEAFKEANQVKTEDAATDERNTADDDGLIPCGEIFLNVQTTSINGNSKKALDSNSQSPDTDTNQNIKKNYGKYPLAVSEEEAKKVIENFKLIVMNRIANFILGK